MLQLEGTIRKTTGKKVEGLREGGLIPAVLYGPEIKELLALEVNYKNFEKIYREAGESSLISLAVAGEKEKTKEFLVLIHDLQTNPLSGNFTHIDFYQPRLGEEIEVMVPLVFDGEAPAQKELGGTLVKNIQEIEIKGVPQKLPKELHVDATILKTFDDRILVKNIALPEGLTIIKDSEEIVALVVPIEKVEEELQTPVEEKVEDVQKVEKEKKAEEDEE